MGFGYKEAVTSAGSKGSLRDEEGTGKRSEKVREVVPTPPRGLAGKGKSQPEGSGGGELGRGGDLGL